MPLLKLLPVLKVATIIATSLPVGSSPVQSSTNEGLLYLLIPA